MLFLIFPIACQFQLVSTQSPSSRTMLGDMGLHEPQLGQELAKRAKLVEVETLRPRNPFRRCCLLSYNPQYVLATTNYSLLSKTWLRQQKHGFTSVVCSQINSLKEIDWLSRPWKNFAIYVCAKNIFALLVAQICAWERSRWDGCYRSWSVQKLWSCCLSLMTLQEKSDHRCAFSHWLVSKGFAPFNNQ